MSAKKDSLNMTETSLKKIAARLRELSKAVTNLPESRSEFSMRVPAEPDRDADLVLRHAADLIEAQLAERGKLVTFFVEATHGDGKLSLSCDTLVGLTVGDKLYSHLAPPAQPESQQELAEMIVRHEGEAQQSMVIRDRKSVV